MENVNNNVNQDIKRQFVDREVKACFSCEMEAIFNASAEGAKDLPNIEDIENFFQYICPECGEGYQEEEDAKSCCNSETEPENEPQEIFEWWIVSEYLYNKLKEKGESVLEWGNNYYWGRGTTGQAILLDYVISEICKDMKILQGQEYDWSKK